MKSIDLKAFRKANNLTQEQLGDYLGIKKSFVSQIESGKCPIPSDRFNKLINNPFGWDVTMLSMESENEFSNLQMEKLISIYNRMFGTENKTLIGYLQSQIDDKDRLIRELEKKIGTLEAKLDLARKGEIVRDVDGSSDADAV